MPDIITRAQYMADSAALHHAYWLQFATPRTFALVENVIGKERIKASTDPHFNDIPLAIWDRCDIISTANKAALVAADGCGGKKFRWSMSSNVCIAKACAKEIKG